MTVGEPVSLHVLEQIDWIGGTENGIQEEPVRTPSSFTAAARSAAVEVAG